MIDCTKSLIHCDLCQNHVQIACAGRACKFPLAIGTVCFAIAGRRKRTTSRGFQTLRVFTNFGWAFFCVTEETTPAFGTRIAKTMDSKVDTVQKMDGKTSSNNQNYAKAAAESTQDWRLWRQNMGSETTFYLLFVLLFGPAIAQISRHIPWTGKGVRGNRLGSGVRKWQRMTPTSWKTNKAGEISETLNILVTNSGANLCALLNVRY